MDKNTIEHLIASSDLVPIVTALQAKEMDRYTITDIGLPSALLMENAGLRIAQAVIKLIKNTKDHLVIILVGPGNNGGDALVAARDLLARNINFIVYKVANEEASCQEQWSFLTQALLQLKKDINKVIKSAEQLIKQKAPWGHQKIIFLDGIFGAGLNRSPSGLALDAIKYINSYRQNNPENCLVLSIDIPSGLSLEANIPFGDFIRADYTITFEYLKRAHISEPTKTFCGHSRCAKIGLFTNTQVNNFYIPKQRVLADLMLSIAKNCHKAMFGHVLVYEGHPRFLGASRLSARAALRAGAGLVTIACEKTAPQAFDLAEFMRCTKADITDEMLQKIDALVIGPGLSKEEDWQLSALEFLNQLKTHIPFIVLDADGLKLLSHQSFKVAKKSIVATPHAKEAADLLGCSAKDIENDRFSAINALAQKFFCPDNEIIWVLKGATPLVRSHHGEIFAFKGELPVLAAAGSGDVLSGAIAGLYRQTASPLAAVLLALSMQIEAGKRLSKSIFKGSLASELADLFPLITKNRPIKALP